MWLIFCVHIIMNRQLRIKTGAFLWSRPKRIRAEKRKKDFADVAYFFACLLFLLLCSFVYISKNPRARMLLSVIYFMQDTLKDPAYIAYHIDIMNYARITSMGISHLREKPT